MNIVFRSAPSQQTGIVTQYQNYTNDSEIQRFFGQKFDCLLAMAVESGGVSYHFIIITWAQI